jgi:hypothetical protein
MNFLNPFFSVIIIALSSTTFAVEECQKYIGSCEYYLCREMNKPCLTKGYFLNFGYKYCMKSIHQLKPKVSLEASEWIVLTSTCLQEQVDQIDDTHTCLQIKKKAIKGHNLCYLESQFCSLTLKDRYQIVKMLIPALKVKGVLFEGIQIFHQCLKK